MARSVQRHSKANESSASLPSDRHDTKGSHRLPTPIVIGTVIVLAGALYQAGGGGSMFIGSGDGSFNDVLGDIVLATHSGLEVHDLGWSGSGRARRLCGAFRAGLTWFEKLKTNMLLKLAGRERTYLVAERANRSILVLDELGNRPWHQYLRKVHRRAVSHCSVWQETRSFAMLPVTAYSCADEDLNTRQGKKASKLLELFRKDAAIAEVLGDVFNIEAATCQHAREGLLVSMQHSKMAPDAFHPDLCTGDQVPFTHKGITVLSYPHDQWDPMWRGNFELQGTDDKAAALLAPLPNRTIVMDGCIRHRATNAAAEAEPVIVATAAADGLLRLDKSRFVNESQVKLAWKEWRFALVMQVACRWLDPDVGDKLG